MSARSLHNEDTSARGLALTLLLRAQSKGKLLSHLIPQIHAAKALSVPERALAERIVKGVMEERSALEAEIEPLIPRGLNSLPKRVRMILLMAVYQIHSLDRVSVEAAANAAVEQTKLQHGARLAGLVNALLRKLAARSDRKTTTTEKLTTQNDAKTIAATYSHPEWLVELLIAEIGPQEAKEFCAYNNTQWPLYFRVNTLKVSADALINILSAEGYDASPTPFLETVLLVKRQRGAPGLDELESFKNGLFFVQDLSAALVGLAAQPRSNEKIIDLCAAPGGKTTHLAEQIADRGTILAVEPAPKRAALIRDNCARLGIKSVQILEASAQELRAPFEADLVLIDAPCSGLGVLGRKKDLRWKKTPEQISELSKLQFDLLTQAARLVRKGGRMLYSTCTVAAAENSALVEEFLRARNDFTLEPIHLPHCESLISAKGYLQTWPQRHKMAGAFAARLLRH